jgi:septum formation protein
LGFDFEIRTKEVDESFPSEMDVTLVAQYLAEKKSRAFGTLAKKELLITSDTTVVLDNRILNKPVDEREASEMLNALSGHSHEVITGVCLSASDKTISFSETTRVYFRGLTKSEIKHYIVTHQPMDKAGAYGIQEWIGMVGIEKIEGDYYNVMGLPTHQLYQKLHQHFL